MLRDDQELTPELSEQIVARLRAHLERTGKSMSWAGRSMDQAESTLSQVCSGKYGADAENVLRKIDKWLESRILKESAPQPSGFIKSLQVPRQIFAVAKYAADQGGIALVHGPAGIGKTITARAIHADRPGSVFISIKTAGQSKLSVLEALGEATTRLRGIKMTSWQIFQQLESALKDTGRMIIVDEIHKLEGRRKDEALHCLRDLHDATGCPMLWLGMTNIARYIETGKSSGYEPLDQLHSRIDYWLDLTSAAKEAEEKGGGGGGGAFAGGLFSIEDIQKIVNHGKLRITPDGTRYLHMLANYLGGGALRTVCKLLQLAAKLSPDDPIDAEKLRGLQYARLGKTAAAALETKMELRAARVA
jgi:DNA transposition AAA+ family ATPase